MPSPKKDDKAEERVKEPEDGFGAREVSPEEEKREISELINPTGPINVQDDGEKEEEEKEEKKGEEKEEKEKEAKKEEEKEEEKEEKEEKKEEEKEEEEEEGKEDKEEEDKTLKELDRLAGLLGKDEKGEKKEEDKEKKKPEEKEEEKEEEKKGDSFDDFVKGVLTHPDFKEQEFVKAEDFQDTLGVSEVAKLNEIVNKAVVTAITESRKQALKDGMEVFPRSLDGRMRGLISANNFWRDNPDIGLLCKKYPNFRNLVSRTSDDIQKRNPKYTLDQVFEKTAKEVRGTLGEERMKKFSSVEADSSGNGKKEKVSFAKKPTNANVRAKKTVEAPTEQDEINELIEFSREL